jgi:hypothetical protein
MQILLDAFIREYRSCLSVDDYDRLQTSYACCRWLLPLLLLKLFAATTADAKKRCHSFFLILLGEPDTVRYRRCCSTCCWSEIKYILNPTE